MDERTQLRFAGMAEPDISPAPPPAASTLYLYGEIFGDGTSTRSVSEFLEANASAGEVQVRINGPGGDVFEGNAVYNLLKQSAAKVVVHIDGLAASMMALIAMAGDEINMAENAMLMIHDPYAPYISGGADKLRRAADMLEQLREQQVAIFAARSGQKPKAVRDAMAAETWYTAKEAKALGYVDKITKSQKLAARLTFDLSGFEHVPEALRAAALAAPVVKQPTPEAAPDGAAHHEEDTMPTPPIKSIVALSLLAGLYIL